MHRLLKDEQLLQNRPGSAPPHNAGVGSLFTAGSSQQQMQHHQQGDGHGAGGQDLFSQGYAEFYYRNRALNPRLPPPGLEALNPGNHANLVDINMLLSGLATKPTSAPEAVPHSRQEHATALLLAQMTGGDDMESMQRNPLSPWASKSQPYESLLLDYSPNTGSPAGNSSLLSGDIPNNSFAHDSLSVGPEDLNQYGNSSTLMDSLMVRQDIKLGPVGSHSGRLLGPSKLRMNSVCEQQPDSPPCFDPRMEASAPPTPSHLLPSNTQPHSAQEVLNRALQTLPIGAEGRQPHPSSSHQPHQTHMSSPLSYRTSDTPLRSRLSTDLSSALPRDTLHQQHQHQPSFLGLHEDVPALHSPLFRRPRISNTQPQSPAAQAALSYGSPFARSGSGHSVDGVASPLHSFTATPAAPQTAHAGLGSSASHVGAGGMRASNAHSAPLGVVPQLPPTSQQLQSMYMAMAAANSVPPDATGTMSGFGDAKMPMASSAAVASNGISGYPSFPTPSMPAQSPSLPFGPVAPNAMPSIANHGGSYLPYDASSMDVAKPMVPPLMFPPMGMPHPFPAAAQPGSATHSFEYGKYYQDYLEFQARGGFAGTFGPGFPNLPAGMVNPNGFHHRGGMIPWDNGPAADVGDMGPPCSGMYGGRSMPPPPYPPHSRDSVGSSSGSRRVGAFEHARMAGKGSSSSIDSQHGHPRGGVNANGVALNHGVGGGRKGGRRDEGGLPSLGQPLTLLEEFKANKAHRFEFKDIMGHVHEFALDQHGSRFIQQKLEVVSADELEVALAEVLPQGTSLMTDVFGNYVMQKFLEHGNRECRERVACVLKGQVLSLALQMYGCRVMQKALEVLEVDTQCSLISELDGNIMRCVRDQNGNHVVQKIIECVPTDRIIGLIDNFLTCVVPLSTHPFGCRVIQRVLEHCQDAERKAFVMEEILKEVCHLAQDQYGNYVIQHVLERGTDSERQQIVSSLAPHVVSMSMHKFASNVIEKCLAHGSTQDRDLMVNCMLSYQEPSPGSPDPPPSANSSEATSNNTGSMAEEERKGSQGGGTTDEPLQVLMKDQYGNYVVQKVLEVCDDNQREQLLARVRAQLCTLKKYTYGKHIVARMEKLLSAGAKIQSHLRARPLPDDLLPLNVRVSSPASSTASAPSVAQQQHTAHLHHLHHYLNNSSNSRDGSGCLTNCISNTGSLPSVHPSTDNNVTVNAQGVALTQQQQQEGGVSGVSSPANAASSQHAAQVHASSDCTGGSPGNDAGGVDAGKGQDSSNSGSRGKSGGAVDKHEPMPLREACQSGLHVSR